MGHYYLVAQLPHLAFGQDPPMTPEAFTELAKSQVDAKDAALLDLVNLDPAPPGLSGEDIPSFAENFPASGSIFIDKWREWERVLRLNLANQRAFKLKREAPFEDVPSDPFGAVSAAAKAVAGAETPLEGEIFLDRARWNAIEELQGSDIFSTPAILAYLLKLKLLERNAMFQQTEKGFAEYK